MVIELHDEVWFINNNRIQKGIIIKKEEDVIEGWYSLWRIKTKYGSQVIEDYRLFQTKDALVKEMSSE